MVRNSSSEPPIVRRLAAIPNKIREKGIRWFQHRLLEELSTPRTAPGRAVRAILARTDQVSDILPTLIISMLPGVRLFGRRTLFFFYDLQVCPITFDMVSYMAGAELERRRLGLDDIHVVIVPGLNDGLRQETEAYEKAVGRASRYWRLHNLAIPIIELFPACKGYTVCASRRHAALISSLIAKHVYPLNWRLRFPIQPQSRDARDAARRGEPIFPMIKVPSQAAEYVERYISHKNLRRKLIVISLRQYAYMPGRNSKVETWLEFAHSLDPEEYSVLIVPDTEGAMEADIMETGNVRAIVAASWNVQLRAALYQRAWLNVAVVHGSMEACFYNHLARYLVFIQPDTAEETMTEALIAAGFELGQSLPFALPWQRWVWQPDEEGAIRREFEAMAAMLTELEASGRLRPMGLP